jgi:hypothetical protein
VGELEQRAAAEQRKIAIMDNIQDHYALVTDALKAGDWRTLGYDSPAAWYRHVASSEHVAPEIRGALVRALRDEGFSLRSIGSELRISKNTAARELGQVSHDGTPARVTGQDGKSYPAGWKQPRELEQVSHAETPDQKRKEIYAALQQAAERLLARREHDAIVDAMLARPGMVEGGWPPQAGVVDDPALDDPADAEQIRREAEEHAAWALRSAEVNRVLDAAVLLHPDAAPVVITVTVYPARPTADDTADTGRASAEDVSRAIAVLQRRFLSLLDDAPRLAR